VRRLVPLSLTLAAEVAAIVALHRWWPPRTDLVGRVLWIAAVLGAWWLLASTVLSVVAQLSRRATALRASTRLTLPAIRRFTERALAASVVAGGLLLAPSAASAQVGSTPEPTVDVNDPELPPPTATLPDFRGDLSALVPVRSGRVGDPLARPAASTEQPEPNADASAPASSDPAPEPHPEVPTQTPDAPPSTDGSAPLPTPLPTPLPAVTTPALSAPAGAAPPPSRTVASGDNLWDIAATHLAAATGRDVATLDESDIAAYWRRVCDVNRARLRSGDVNLIFADEVIELPAL
jgi:hypothetical protein